jgi:hypothetical protein
MRNDQDSRQLRRYVLGAATDEECDAIERQYFDRVDAADRVSAAEDDLIDDYLSGRLDGSERPRFERHYLSTPNHRRRVAIVRALKNAASAGQPVGPRRPVTVWWTIAGVAAALVILISGAMWLTRSRSGSTDALVERSGQPAAPSASADSGSADRRAPAAADQPVAAPATPPAAPIVVAVSISPILVRGDSEPAELTMSGGVDIVRLHLNSQANEPRLGRGHAIVRTVAGREVWRGPAVEVKATSEELARVDIPAPALLPDDYVVELFGTAASGREVERHRYFLRVRAR